MYGNEWQHYGPIKSSYRCSDAVTRSHLTGEKKQINEKLMFTLSLHQCKLFTAGWYIANLHWEGNDFPGTTVIYSALLFLTINFYTFRRSAINWKLNSSSTTEGIWNSYYEYNISVKANTFHLLISKLSETFWSWDN